MTPYDLETPNFLLFPNLAPCGERPFPIVFFGKNDFPGGASCTFSWALFDAVAFGTSRNKPPLGFSVPALVLFTVGDRPFGPAFSLE